MHQYSSVAGQQSLCEDVGLDKLRPTKTNLDQVRPTWSSLDQHGPLRPTWTDLDQLGQSWIRPS